MKSSALFWSVPTTEGVGRDPTPYAFIAAESSEKLNQFKARAQAELDQTDKLVIASPGVDGIHLRPRGKLKCGTAKLLVKVCR